MNGKMLLLFAASLVARGQTPVVRSAIVNSTTNQITIAGSSLLPTSGSPVVYLDGELLTLVSSSGTKIVADMPSGLGAGSFRLVVGAGVFDVTNGAVGPAGPAGATGATGAIGPAGPQGPSGSLTLPFSGTASNTTTCVFCITNTAPEHAAIAGTGGQALSGANSGGTGVGAYGGPSNGSSTLAGSGGSGVYAAGGRGTAEFDSGGIGLNGYGGNAEGEAATAGPGVKATGGNAGGETAFGGDGIDAFGGTGGLGAGVGIYAVAGVSNTSSLTPFAGVFSGDVNVAGALSKSSGSFKIDHPLDPANKYRYHSFVESPDMMNIYNGNVVTDGSGTAIVTMPAWFEALNTDFRYQLTVIGQFAQAIVASEITNGSFTIKTSKPEVKVSWQVTGIRQDAWANAHRIKVEVDKAQRDQGHYIHPELFGHEGEPSIAEMHHPRPSASAPAQ
jgi:trimeric autotransporter adhesin